MLCYNQERMKEASERDPDYAGISPIRFLAEWVFSRTAGAALERGNSVRILKDAKENYPAWIEAITGARQYVHFESYIIHDDDVGLTFANLLVGKAREGVRVRVLYDWLGAFGKTPRRFWNSLRAAGVEVRCFNPPRFDSPFGWLTRDHRKMISVDGETAFVTGLCVGRMWVGDPKRSVEPWRDTGVIIQGPAVADIDLAFAQMWEIVGEPLPEDELNEPETTPRAGDVALRVIASAPNTAGLYRLDQLIAALAQNSLWLTDAYFVGATPYVQALRSAAMDGVDVRLLVPGSTDIPVFQSVSRAGYYPLLDAGVRVFEWNGPMVHAKTAVADGRWARVGSTNLNLASWIGNYELDVAVEDEQFAGAMEEMYLEDLTHATEIVLSEHRVRAVGKKARWSLKQRKPVSGSVTRAGAGAIRIGSAVGAAMTNHRFLGPAEAKIMAILGAILFCLAPVFVLWPRWIGIPVALVAVWLAASLMIRARRLYVTRRRDENAIGDTGMGDFAPPHAEEEQDRAEALRT
jgi:cardiolipin synthase A/B